MSQPTVLVPLDGSDRSQAALPVARVFSTIMEANLRIVHVSGHTFSEPMALAVRLGLGPEMLHGSSLEARVGEPAAEILAAAREMSARLIVMCTHTALQRPPAILGATALSVLRDARWPVVLVSPEHRLGNWRLRRVLFPLDGSSGVSAAVAAAAALAKQAGAELLAVMVASPGRPGSTEAGALAMPRYLDHPQHEWPAWASEFIERLACRCPGSDLRMYVHLRSGRPGPEIVRMAAEQAVDFIVLAWKGEWAEGRADVIKAIIRDAPCPAMVAKMSTGGTFRW
jgi:nucleotide-binding universal stress UspA family protein